MHSGEYVCSCLHVYSVYSEEQELCRTMPAVILLRSEEHHLRRTISELSKRLAQITASQSQQVSQTFVKTDPEDAATPCSQPAAGAGEELLSARLEDVLSTHVFSATVGQRVKGAVRGPQDFQSFVNHLEGNAED